MYAVFFCRRTQTFRVADVPHFQVRNPGGKKTPQDSVRPTPNLRRIEETEELLSAATTHRSQSALKDLARFD
jgi:hypothetical protein